MFECPFYKEFNACTTHSNCVFNKAGGCAIELAAIFSGENKEKLEEIESSIQELEYKINNLERKINSK